MPKPHHTAVRDLLREYLATALANHGFKAPEEMLGLEDWATEELDKIYKEVRL